MSKRAMTTEKIDALPRRKGERYEVADPGCDRLWLRVGARDIVFVLAVRVEGKRDPTRLKLGVYAETTPGGDGSASADAKPGPLTRLTLEQAREKARRWNAWIKAGLDPRAEEARLEVEAAKRSGATFRRALEDYLAHMPGRKHNKSVVEQEKHLRRELLDRPERNPFLDKPLVQIDDLAVAAIVAAVRNRPAPTSAFNLFRLIRTFFAWAYASENRLRYYLGPNNPMAGRKGSEYGLGPTKRRRFLDDDERAAYLRAAAATPYPYGPFYEAMLKMGQREGETAGIRRSEIDMADRLWTIPKERFKSNRAHAVPLSDQMMALIEAVLNRLPADMATACSASTTARRRSRILAPPCRRSNRLCLRSCARSSPAPRWSRGSSRIPAARCGPILRG
ncbi:integrase family protein [Rhizobium sp. NZLR1]|uniref:tyrosine-type recombinase/integrase n=1 Tax=Rhizobium sp. NZLR1 TaxID=2731096 RepID=UPI001C83A308|nr:integrase arm-type DNA-binding domain-containing protein [Rhizobium sp. NZLR1]MBX5201356.1 integrase family protein [Rhizobium sp. NZLR1]